MARATNIRYHPSGPAVMNTPAGVSSRIAGLRKVKNKLNNILRRKLPNATYAGLIAAATHIQRQTETVEPITPRRSGAEGGNLVESWRIVPEKSKGEDNVVRMGYWANYAAFVHEMTVPPYTKPINWSRPGSGAKWFEIAIKRNEKEIIRIVAQHTNVKKLGP